MSFLKIRIIRKSMNLALSFKLVVELMKRVVLAPRLQPSRFGTERTEPQIDSLLNLILKEISEATGCSSNILELLLFLVLCHEDPTYSCTPCEYLATLFSPWLTEEASITSR